MEAGNGIEPIYTALQAAALTNKSIRCVRLTPGLTPGARHYAHSCSYASWVDPALDSCRNFARRNAKFIDRIRDTPKAAMQREEVWLSCLAVILQTISVHV